MKYSALAGVAVCLALCGSLTAQSVTLPKEVKGEARRLLAVAIDYDGDDIRWTISDKVDVFREYDPDAKKIRLRILAPTDGEYELKAIACKDKKLCEFVTCKIIIGKGPDPGPGPNPPDPPGPTPEPSTGKWLYIVYESMDTLPTGQANILTSSKIRTYLRPKLKKDGGLKDGELVIWDKDTDAAGYPKEWQDRHAKYKGKVAVNAPYFVLSDGKAITEGPLPKDVDAFLAELKKKLGE